MKTIFISIGLALVLNGCSTLESPSAGKEVFSGSRSASPANPSASPVKPLSCGMECAQQGRRAHPDVDGNCRCR